tara:strand:- start:311 stop:517 length:207 start_codon:yes stop_codon:yes gene_type:complete
MKKIIFPNKTGLTILVPSGELSIQETAEKDVPTGVKFKILDASDLPNDYEFFDAWEFDFESDNDGVGS